jgi:hypothetical protein
VLTRVNQAVRAALVHGGAVGHRRDPSGGPGLAGGPGDARDGPQWNAGGGHSFRNLVCFGASSYVPLDVSSTGSLRVTTPVTLSYASARIEHAGMIQIVVEMYVVGFVVTVGC